MKALKKIVLFAFAFFAMYGVSAQQANEVLGFNANSVSVDNYENVYPAAINSQENIVLACYINKLESQNVYFTSTIKKNSEYGQRVLQDIKSYQGGEDMNISIMVFETSDLSAATYRQMHQLKRERVLATLQQDDKIWVVSYDKDFYRQHILNR